MAIVQLLKGAFQPEIDSGAIIDQAVCKVYPTDTISTLSERVLRCEHNLYPKCVDRVASGAVTIPIAHDIASANVVATQ